MRLRARSRAAMKRRHALALHRHPHQAVHRRAVRARSIRTLDIFVSTLLEATGGKLPENFVVTLPKVTVSEQVDGARRHIRSAGAGEIGLARGSLKMEIDDRDDAINHQRSRPNRICRCSWQPARGRCIAAHFGTYDYTASCQITAAHQHMTHPACDFARHMMQVAFGGTGVWLSDGATNIMPVAPHRADSRRAPLYTQEQIEENTRHSPSRLETALRPHPALARQRLLSGLGPASGATADALCRRL